MDKLAQQLRDDAARIEAGISDELDRRIDASLHAATPAPAPRAPTARARPPLFWWASTITGAAAALAVIALVNWPTSGDVPPPPPAYVSALPPPIDLNAEAAMLTTPLRQELENLQSDLKKAEEKVKREIGL